jgi:hypothetical protein
MIEAKSVVDALRSCTIEHPRYVALNAQVYAQAILGAPGDVIFIAGPTRVGKTTLKRSLIRELNGAMGAADGLIPVIDVEAATTQQGRFSTKHFTLRMLEELRDPVLYGGCGSVRRAQSETFLRLHLEDAIRSRGTRYLILDEAHHFLRAPSSMHATDVLDWIKCIGNRTSAITVMFGGYDILQFCYSSAHLNGRSTFFNFSRYRPTRCDLEDFDRVLASIDQIVGEEIGISLLEHRSVIYDGSLGCIGLVTSWLTSALSNMIGRGANFLAWEDFSAVRSENQISPIRAEIDMGESILGVSDDVVGKIASCGPTSERQKRSGRPFQRKPRRDPVG